MSEVIEVSAETARRFVLGRQGLWPGRRWSGKDGARQAMRAVEHLQLDPLVIVARSHDLMLHSRVEGYAPEQFDELTHRDREFFDWGGWLAVRPMDELPYWRVLMRRNGGHGSTGEILEQNPDVIPEMRKALKDGARLSSRDLEATGTETGKTYRGSKARALALYYLWRTGEAMTYERRGFERVYAATEFVAPPELLGEVDEREAELFLARKEIASQGIGKLPTASLLTYRFHREFAKADRDDLARELQERGELTSVVVEGWRGPQFVATADLPLLAAVASGDVPSAWLPLAPTVQASFLSPLDPVVARGRAKELCGFEHVWEIYKKPADVRFGRFTMPVLWGQDLVARMDARLDRVTATLVVNGIWLEDPATMKKPEFVEALTASVQRLMAFLAAERIDVAAVSDAKLRVKLARIRR